MTEKKDKFHFFFQFSRLYQYSSSEIQRTCLGFFCYISLNVHQHMAYPTPEQRIFYSPTIDATKHVLLIY